MAIPQPVAGQLLDVRRFLAFRNDVEVNTLIFYDEAGAELRRIDHFWHVLPPRIRFGDNHETVQFLVTEDEVALDATMAATRSLRYEVKRFFSPGSILSFSIVTTGADYFVGGTGTIDGGDSLAAFEVLTVGFAQQAESIKLTNRGSGYISGETTTQAGLGFGLTLNITEVGEILVSDSHKCKSIPKPPLGRNRTWDIRTTTETFVNEFFQAPGE